MPAQQLNDLTLKNLSALKAYYRFESGALTTDSKGSNTLSAVSDPAETTGYFGGGADFDGNDAYSIVDASDLKPTGHFTVGAWVKTSTTGAEQGIFQSWHGTNLGGIVFRIITNNSIGLGVGSNSGAGGFTDNNASTSVCDGNWHFVVGTYDGSNIRLWIDGKLENTVSRASGATYNATNYVRIACENNTGTNIAFLTGTLDDVFLFTGLALSADHIKEMYEGRTVGELAPQPNLVALYHLSNTTDYSGNNRTLTNNNSVIFTDYGKFVKAANFGTANTNKSLYVASDLGITGGSITMSCWVKLNTEIASSLWNFVTQGDASTFVDFHIRYEFNSGTRRLRFDRTRRGSVTTNAFYNITLGTTNWTHIVMTYDGTTIKGYVNGNFVASATASGNGVSNTEDNFGIGADTATFVATGGSLFASATIDEVAVFSKALSDREIANYYQWAVGRFAEVI